MTRRLSLPCRRAGLGAAFALVLAGIVAFAPNAQAAGATTPFTSYEAEAGTLTGGATTVSLTAAPTTQYSSPALEASGHAYVHLAGTGQQVWWTNNTGQPISFVNVRVSIPDTSSGGGSTGTLDLYVNGAFRQSLSVNSKQTWLYEGNNNYNGNDQNPADGDPRVFFDETHAFVTGAPIAPGSTFSLVKSAGNTAAFYDVDVVDVENPPAPLPQPANSISITSCGAVADNTPTNGAPDGQSTDSTAAIQNCVNQAQSQHKTLWIPPGTFYLKGITGLNANGITIAGAGMWYSTIYRAVPLPNNTPLAAIFSVTSCTVQNLHLDSNATSRAPVDGAGGAMDTTGTNWVANGIWTQHTLSGFWASGTGGTVENSRLTTIWADGINLNNVSLNGSTGNNLTARNNFVRGTGDDAIAVNSVAYNGSTTYTAMANATIANNTSIAPWGGKGISIYGGSGHHVQDNYISDTARYIGLGAGRFGVNGSDLSSTTISGNVIVRSGGNAYNQGQPALHVGNGGDGQNTGAVDRITVSGNTIANSVYDGVGISQSTNTLLQNNTITSPWRNGIAIAPPFYPAPTGSATITGNTVTGLRAGNTPYANNSGGFTASVSGNSWQSAPAPAWTGTWSVSPQAGGPSFSQQTLRQIVHTSIGGPSARVEVSNAFGSAPLVISDVHVAQRTSGSTVTNDHAVTFGGQSTTTIPAGGLAISDAVGFAVPALSDVAISMYLPQPTGASTFHQQGNATNYVAAGDVSGNATLSGAQNVGSYYFLSNLDVQGGQGAVVTLGASITDGVASGTDDNRRWPNDLAVRLASSGRAIGVLNQGISGNRLLVDGAGPSALNRFTRDVLAQSGAQWVIFSDDPINDLGSTSPPPSADQLIAGAQQLVSRAHAQGLKFLCSTLTPYEGAGYWTQQGETAREAFNAFVRGSGSGCDGVVDQDAATHDPAHPTRYLPAYDAGDHLHPNEAGLQAIANAVNLDLFD